MSALRGRNDASRPRHRDAAAKPEREPGRASAGAAPAARSARM